MKRSRRACCTHTKVASARYWQNDDYDYNHYLLTIILSVRAGKSSCSEGCTLHAASDKEMHAQVSSGAEALVNITVLIANMGTSRDF